MAYLFLQATVVEQFMQTPITGILLLIMIAVSFKAFNDEELHNKLLFVPALMHERGASEYYRFISAGFIHADWLHLGFNGFVFWQFGGLVERYYKMEHGPMLGSIFYLILFFGGLVAASLFSYYKHKNNYGYRALGASGAVSGVLFAAIVFQPLMPLQLIFLPFIKIPAVVMGALYLLYSSYMARKGNDNIGHDAHFWGSVWGFVLTIALKPLLFLSFIDQIMSFFR
jgi:membrane associated rhomboid family serine protease